MSDVLETASDAYVYFYPVVQNLKTLYFSSVWAHGPNYRAPVNQFSHASQLLDWRFTAVVAPNNDTLYSQAWLDLEQQPIVLSVPDVPLTVEGKKRYYSMQIVDGYTFNTRILSPRTTGNWAADSYAIVGPSYVGTIPSKFDKDHIVRCSSRFVLVLGRTGVNGKADIPSVQAIQKGYLLTPLRQEFLSDSGTVSLSVLPNFPYINKDELAKDSPEPQVFFSYANFIMEYIEIEPYEAQLFQRFRNLSIGPKLSFEGQSMSNEKYLAIKTGVAAGSKKIDLAPLIDGFGNLADGWIGAIDPPIFGTAEVLKQKYATRAFAAKVGLYGADPQEAYYPSSSQDVDGDPFDGTKYKYTLTFPAGKLPPVQDGGFWSITVYRMPERLLVHNPADTYSVGDRTKGLVFENGALTLYIQKDKPSTDAKVANWLPAPDPEYAGYDTGMFSLTMRIYWPTAEALRVPYLPPGVAKAGPALTARM